MFWFNFGKATSKPVTGSENYTRFENKHQRLDVEEVSAAPIKPTHPQRMLTRQSAMMHMRSADQGYANDGEDGSEPTPAILRAALPVRFGKIDDANVARIKASDAFEFSGLRA